MSATTLARRADHAAVIRHSRFVASAAPVDSVDAAMAYIAGVAVADATHNCWAYRLGETYRFSDDNEVSGTAGRPILAAIDGQGLDRVVVVVTRWYGGTKLGTGGLVRAYGGTAAECLRTAPRIPLVEYVECDLAFAFEDTGPVHAALAVHAVERLDERHGANGTHLSVRLPADRLDALRDQLRDATRDRAELTSRT